MLLDLSHDRHTFTLAAALLLCLAGAARAQTSANLTLVSEYAVRGIALSSHPALQLRVERDTDAGWYGGGFVSPVTLRGRDQAQFIAYAGRARRLSSFLSWDAGVTGTLFQRQSNWNYHEFYAGLALRRASARIFYSPAYYGQTRSAYLDLNGSYGLGDHLSLAVHAGVLHPFEGYDKAQRNRGDARLALVADAGDYSLQVGWQAQWQAYLRSARRAHAATASVSLHF